MRRKQKPRKKKRDVINASGIGQFVYCNRAWHYARKGIRPRNPEALDAGSAYHEEHARGVRLARTFIKIAVGMALLGGFVLILSVIRALLGAL
jgi:hypothetical protein